jgi:hypothetical protein
MMRHANWLLVDRATASFFMKTLGGAGAARAASRER